MKPWIKEGDSVSVKIGNDFLTLNAEVLYIACATGDSWVFKEKDTEKIMYVSEGCTIIKL